MTDRKQTIRAGTRIELFGTPAMCGFPAVPVEQATIARWTKINGPVPNHGGAYNNNPGWHVIKFADGGMLLCHESRFRVTDNRAGFGS